MHENNLASDRYFLLHSEMSETIFPKYYYGNIKASVANVAIVLRWIRPALSHSTG